MLPTLVLSCEHGGAEVPPEYRTLFAGRGALLDSHRGRDAGALDLAQRLARATGAPLVSATTTRLLVDLNRSLHHRDVFSEITRPLSGADRDRIITEYYRPHRERVRAAVCRQLEQGRQVLHLSVHSFTPVVRGRRRKTTVALLYDPSRVREASLCGRWKQLLGDAAPRLTVRRNYPFRGVADGFTTALRGELPAASYLGVELEVNQRLRRDPTSWERVGALLAETLVGLVTPRVSGGAAPPSVR
jgi:predicted N-formylglutamate amidohydrolase